MFTADGYDTDIFNKVDALEIFGDKIFRVYDPKSLAEIARKLNPPICGVVYEGIASDSVEGDTGTSSYLSVSLFILADNKVRDFRQASNKTTIATLLDQTRKAILKTWSPATTAWEFVVEIPFPISDRDLGYYQKWKTKVSV